MIKIRRDEGANYDPDCESLDLHHLGIECEHSVHTVPVNPPGLSTLKQH